MIEINREAADNGARIMVIGVGGGGNNTVERMIADRGDSVEFVCVNTDKQQLAKCKAPKVIQIGEKLTHGLGCGAEPEKGEKSAEENREEIAEVIRGVEMVFVTCGMGGGTGTGAAPVVAQIAKESGVLTVGVVTKPFKFEQKVRMKNAESGIERLRHNVDTLIVVPNEKLFETYPDMEMSEGFRKADEVLEQAVYGITDIIKNNGIINLDFADVSKIMKDKGIAHVGIGSGSGENKCITAMNQAIQSPLLESSINGAKSVMVNYTGKVTMREVNEAQELLANLVDSDAEIIFGLSTGGEQSDRVTITVIATGIENNGGNNRTQQFPAGNGIKFPAQPAHSVNMASSQVQQPTASIPRAGYKPISFLNQGGVTQSSNIERPRPVASAPVSQPRVNPISQPVKAQTNVRPSSYTAPSNISADKDEPNELVIPQFLSRNKK